MRAWTRRVKDIISQMMRDVARRDGSERRMRAWTRRVKDIISQKMRGIALRPIIAKRPQLQRR